MYYLQVLNFDNCVYIQRLEHLPPYQKLDNDLVKMRNWCSYVVVEEAMIKFMAV